MYSVRLVLLLLLLLRMYVEKKRAPFEVSDDMIRDHVVKFRVHLRGLRDDIVEVSRVMRCPRKAGDVAAMEWVEEVYVHHPPDNLRSAFVNYQKRRPQGGLCVVDPQRIVLPPCPRAVLRGAAEHWKEAVQQLERLRCGDPVTDQRIPERLNMLLERQQKAERCTDTILPAGMAVEGEVAEMGPLSQPQQQEEMDQQQQKILRQRAPVITAEHAQAYDVAVLDESRRAAAAYEHCASLPQTFAEQARVLTPLLPRTPGGDMDVVSAVCEHNFEDWLASGAVLIVKPPQAGLSSSSGLSGSNSSSSSVGSIVGGDASGSPSAAGSTPGALSSSVPPSPASAPGMAGGRSPSTPLSGPSWTLASLGTGSGLGAGMGSSAAGVLGHASGAAPGARGAMDPQQVVAAFRRLAADQSTRSLYELQRSVLLKEASDLGDAIMREVVNVQGLDPQVAAQTFIDVYEQLRQEEMDPTDDRLLQ